MAPTRRLAAIMFTDLVGFIRLAQRDEEDTLRLRKEHQSLLRPLVSARGGREVKTLGDGFLIEFPSAVESVRCAVEIQTAVAQRDALPSSKDRIVLRIGIRVGDVVGERDDILGDAVNIASRIEPLAEPGGICVSGSVFDQVRNKLEHPLEKVAPRELKNVDFPADLYRVVLPGDRPRLAPVEDGSGFDLRMAVLPFAIMSPDSNDKCFADGLTDELITQTSRTPNLRVISRTSVQQYKGSSKSLRDVAQDLGVRLALEGSVRKAGNLVRITVKLVDTASEENLWPSTYNRPLDDIFSIQDDIAGQIAKSITPHLSGRHRGGPPEFLHGTPDTQDMEAYVSFLHARKLLSEKGSDSTIRQSLAFFETAVERDPSFARARVGIAEATLWLGSEGALPQSDAVRRSREELTKALQQNDSLAEAHSVLASLLVGEDAMTEAEREARRATELNPSLSDPYRWLAQLAAGDGRIDESVRLLETAQRLAPLDVNILSFLGRAYFYAGRTADAVAHWERTKPLVPFRTNANLTEYYLTLGNFAKAQESLHELERLRPKSAWTEMYQGFFAGRSGDLEGARRAIAQLERRSQKEELPAFFVGFVHFALGEMDPFFACLEEAFRRRDLPLMELQYSPLFESARSDPRMVNLLHRQFALRGR